MNGYIYKITNLINGKIYIGQTVKSLDERFKEHLNEAFSMNNMRPLYKAMRKYGRDQFNIELIDEAPLEDLSYLECYYIKVFDSLAINGIGYNLTYGGEGNRRTDYDLIRKLWDKGLCTKQICDRTNFGRFGVAAALKSHPTYSVAEARRRGCIYQNAKRLKKVYQYSAQGEFLNEFSNVHEAAKSVNQSINSLRAALEIPGSASGTYQWSYYKFDRINCLSYTPHKYNQKICELDKDGNIVATYESAKAAAEILDIRSDYIRAACRHPNHICIKTEKYFKYEDET